MTPSQTPGKWVFDVQGDFYLARSAAGLPTVVPGLPGDLGAAMVSPFARVRRGAVEELAALLTHPDEVSGRRRPRGARRADPRRQPGRLPSGPGLRGRAGSTGPPEPAPEPAPPEPALTGNRDRGR